MAEGNSLKNCTPADTRGAGSNPALPAKHYLMRILCSSLVRVDELRKISYLKAKATELVDIDTYEAIMRQAE